MYKLKTVSEDFVVREILNFKFKEEGDYSCFLLRKKDIEINEVLGLISKELRVSVKKIGIAGNKDKRALTEQYISLYGLKKDKNKDFEFDKFSLKFLGFLDKRINLGEHEENEFEITVRNLDSKMDKKVDFIVNYFDEQRFSKDNVNNGVLILKKEFNVLERYGRRKLRFFLHSLQSYIYNYILASYLKDNFEDIKNVEYSLGEFIFIEKKIENFKIPLVGFDIEIKKKFSEYFNEAMGKLEIKKEDFLVREKPELIEETCFRDCIVNVKDYKILKYEKDELNEGKFKQVISFRLNKGSYATILIKQYF
ncbi:hypothetical protein CL617_00215 [archaeon]|nr:hypothetical protein [archaeon]|tara:strand:- start:14089 stop:15015 length:927 start_codon:yes stop_codon:yes gene_type:complete